MYTEETENIFSPMQIVIIFMVKHYRYIYRERYRESKESVCGGSIKDLYNALIHLARVAHV